MYNKFGLSQTSLAITYYTITTLSHIQEVVLYQTLINYL